MKIIDKFQIFAQKFCCSNIIYYLCPLNTGAGLGGGAGATSWKYKQAFALFGTALRIYQIQNMFNPKE